MHLLAAIVLYLSALALGIVLPPGSAWTTKPGVKLFKKHCKVCHTIGRGEPKRQGPNLWGVAGRLAGAVVSFKYSDGLKDSGITWTRENLDSWLTDPKALVPGSVMLYKQKDAEIRRQIIDYVMSANQ